MAMSKPAKTSCIWVWWTCDSSSCWRLLSDEKQWSLTTGSTHKQHSTASSGMETLCTLSGCKLPLWVFPISPLLPRWSCPYSLGWPFDGSVHSCPSVLDVNDSSSPSWFLWSKVQNWQHEVIAGCSFQLDLFPIWQPCRSTLEVYCHFHLIQKFWWQQEGCAAIHHMHINDMFSSKQANCQLS